jgi:hypothetical protein
MLKQTLKLTCLILCLLFAFTFVNAQTTTDPLQSAVDEAEAKAKIAKAKKEEIDAKFPKPDSSALVGGTTVKGDFIEAKMLGFCAMKKASKDISTEIITNASITKPANFVVYSESDVKMLSRYQLMINRLILLEQGYDSLCPTAGGVNPCGARPGFRLLGAGLVANKVLDFLSLLKTDIEITGTEFDIDEKNVVAEVFKNLPSNNLYYPQRIPLSATNFATKNAAGKITGINSDLFDHIVSLGKAYDFARNLATPQLERDRLDNLYLSTMIELGLAVEPKTPSAAGGGGGGGACPGGCSQTTNVNVNVGEKQKENSGGGGGSDKTFFSYLQAEKLYEMMGQANSYWLDLQVVKAGGNIRVKSNFITNFMIGSRVTFSGGAIVYFNVFDNQGLSKISGAFPVYQKYTKSSQIMDRCK